MKKVSGLLVGAGNEMIPVAIPIWKCDSCGEICTEFMAPDIKEEFGNPSKPIKSTLFS